MAIEGYPASITATARLAYSKGGISESPYSYRRKAIGERETGVGIRTLDPDLGKVVVRRLCVQTSICEAIGIAVLFVAAHESPPDPKQTCRGTRTGRRSAFQQTMIPIAAAPQSSKQTSVEVP
jgi:hypothetical protein